MSSGFAHIRLVGLKFRFADTAPDWLGHAFLFNALKVCVENSEQVHISNNRAENLPLSGTSLDEFQRRR